MIALLIDVVGFLAAGATLAAFYCTRMMMLRAVAIAANLLFIAYGAVLDLKPVLALHCVLLPLNVVRLREAWRDNRGGRETAGPAALGTPHDQSARHLELGPMTSTSPRQPGRGRDEDVAMRPELPLAGAEAAAQDVGELDGDRCGRLADQLAPPAVSFHSRHDGLEPRAVVVALQHRLPDPGMGPSDRGGERACAERLVVDVQQSVMDEGFHPNPSRF